MVAERSRSIALPAVLPEEQEKKATAFQAEV